MFQHQANAAAGDPALREPVRRQFMRLFDDIVPAERRDRGRGLGLHGAWACSST